MVKTRDHNARRRIMVLGLGGGGFHWEVERLLEQTQGDFELVLVYVIASQVRENWGLSFPIRGAFVVRPPLYRDSWWQQIWRTALAFWRAIWILLISQPDCLVAVGTAQAIPFGLAARTLGIPIIFIESITRVKKSSATGRLVNQLRLAARHYVQWEALANQVKGTSYSGSILK